ncbi:rho GTPase-activating protein 100F-like [Saccoglossus kowalevskii]|uniref:Rho GTPase-activating protein 100F-like n=1 Tax=Saccoglossus kowalevskii TaxID=10224 RepID=A0ABM0GXR8_SACKO|nr:PREDICTED: rho GTPase-activating protein 100F-like [Saccoglossus kowalevskii]
MESTTSSDDVSTSNDGHRHYQYEPLDHHVLQVKRVAGISSEIVKQIQATEEIISNMDRDDSDSLSGSSVSTVTVEGKQVKSCVIQERELQGGACCLRTVEIHKIPGETLGIYIMEGDGFDKKDGIFISRLTLGSVCDQNGLLQIGDEILSVNNVDVTRMNLDEVCHVMKIPSRLLITVKTKQIETYKRYSRPVDRSREELRHSDDDVVSLMAQRYLRSKSDEPPPRPSTAPSSTYDYYRRSNDSDYMHLSKSRNQRYSNDCGMGGMEHCSDSRERVMSQADDSSLSRSWESSSESLSRRGRNSLERMLNSPRGSPTKMKFDVPKPPEVVISSEEHPIPQTNNRPKLPPVRPTTRPKSSSDVFDNETKFIDDDDVDISVRRRERKKGPRYSQLSPSMGLRSPTTSTVSSDYDALTSPRYIRKGVSISGYSWDDSLPELTGSSRQSRREEYERPKSAQTRSASTSNSPASSLSKEKPKRQVRKYMGSKSDVSPLRKSRGKMDCDSSSVNPARILWQRLHWSKGDSKPVAVATDFQDTGLPELGQGSGSMQYEELLLSPRELKPDTMRDPARSKRDIPKSPDPRVRRGKMNSHQGQAEDNADLFEQQKMSMMLQTLSKSRKVSKMAQTKVSGRPDIRSEDSLDTDSTITSEQSIDEEDCRYALKKSSIGRPLEIDLTGFLKYRRDSASRSKGDVLALSGILFLRIHGGRKLATLRNQTREMYGVVEVDSEAKARTCSIYAKDEFTWDENFEIELENSQELNLMIYSCEGDTKHKLCYKGLVRLVSLFRENKNVLHQLALKLEPRGILYTSLSFTESTVSLKRTPSMNRSGVFGVTLESVVRRERSGTNVPLIVQKCVREIEDRGLDLIGVYRVCGSAKRKKSLKCEFDQNSASVNISAEICPDINVITGCLKDYLRELPEPLFTNSLCQKLMEILMAPEADPKASAELVLKLMSDLPQANQDTLEFLLDHLKLIAAHAGNNKMNTFNLAVCFGPVLMSPTPTSERDYVAAIDFEKHIEVLQHLLDIWPEEDERVAIKMRLTEKSVKNKNDSQEDDSCYHSIDDLDDAPTTAKAEEHWDSENLEVSAC